ncbi:MAG TPA: hypothetical protein VEQ40_03100 [Pyrinomonadaceae bacterium]|nr:hypothetical protein [Pyrinomonadaceae bacterium]
MGVIGRLDDQVNEIIIKPVGERHKAVDEEAPQAVSQTHAPPPPATTEEKQDEEKAEAASSELPVWLL